MVSRHTTSKGESWKARASEPKGCVQARTVGITAPGVESGGGRQGRGLLPALGRARPLVLRSRNCLDTYDLHNKYFRQIGAFAPHGDEPKGGTMQDSYNAHSTTTALGASSQQHPSMSEKKGVLSRCECCNAAIPAARNFAPAVSATAISCIVCGHQNQSSEPFALPSRMGSR